MQRRINDNIATERGYDFHHNFKRCVKNNESNQNSKHVFSNPQLQAKDMSDSIIRKTLDTFDVVSPQDQNSLFLHKSSLKMKPEFPKTTNLHYSKKSLRIFQNSNNISVRSNLSGNSRGNRDQIPMHKRRITKRRRPSELCNNNLRCKLAKIDFRDNINNLKFIYRLS